MRRRSWKRILGRPARAIMLRNDRRETFEQEARELLADRIPAEPTRIQRVEEALIGRRA